MAVGGCARSGAAARTQTARRYIMLHDYVTVPTVAPPALVSIRGTGEYNSIMARGWESKAVEAQIDLAQAHHRPTKPAIAPSPETLELIRRKENILLSRTRVVRELDNAQNPRYKAVLTKALADLDAQLTSIAAV
jgi:hypothetical protein